MLLNAVNCFTMQQKTGFLFGPLLLFKICNYSQLSLSQNRLSQISGYVKMFSAVPIFPLWFLYSSTPLNSNLDVSKLQIHQTKFFVPTRNKLLQSVGQFQTPKCYKMQNDNNSDFHTYHETCENWDASNNANYRQSGCQVI